MYDSKGQSVGQRGAEDVVMLSMCVRSDESRIVADAERKSRRKARRARASQIEAYKRFIVTMLFKDHGTRHWPLSIYEYVHCSVMMMHKGAAY